MSGNHRPLEEIDVELIEHIKASPCIYDTAHPDFRLVYKKDHQWGVVADSLGMSVEEARKRWTVLRDRFARELKQMHLNTKKQSSGKNEFFCRMDFLRGFIKKRRVRKKIGDLKADKNTDNSFAFEIVEMHPQMIMQDIEESQESTSESKYAYVQDQRNEVSQNPKMEQVPECDEYQEYVDDSYDRVMTNQDTSCTSSISNAIYNNNADMKSTMYQGNPNNEEIKPPAPPPDNATESEDLFSKVIASYLKNLSRRYKIKAKVEMMQILEKYIEIEEGETQT